MPHPLNYTRYDWDVAGRTLFGEARGESWVGLLGVAWVIRNRVERPGWWGHNVAQVCQADKQFSCWNPGDPNRELLLHITQDNRDFRRCLGAVACVFSGDAIDETHGATNYFTAAKPVWANVWPPAWADRMIQTAVVGAHLFYRDAKPGELTTA